MKNYCYTLFFALLIFLSKTVVSQQNTSIDSLLKIRELFISQDKLTTQIDRELMKRVFSPQVVVSKTGGIYHFYYYNVIPEPVIEKFKERLLNTFKIKNIHLNSERLEGSVQFLLEANEIDKVNFFKAFGYDVIVYKK